MKPSFAEKLDSFAQWNWSGGKAEQSNDKASMSKSVAKANALEKELTAMFSNAESKLKNLPLSARLLPLCVELDMEMDGVKCPKTAAAILNGIRSIVNEYRNG